MAGGTATLVRVVLGQVNKLPLCTGTKQIRLTHNTKFEVSSVFGLVGLITALSAHRPT